MGTFAISAGQSIFITSPDDSVKLTGSTQEAQRLLIESLGGGSSESKQLVDLYA